MRASPSCNSTNSLQTMLNALSLILVCQLAGELLSVWAGLPVPGPVAGMVLLFAYLVVRGGISDNMAMTADGLLRHLSLLFVPAGVGVMLHFKLLEKDGLAVAAALVVSTLAAVAVTGWVMAKLSGRGRS
jgi:holin-like protein